MTKRRACSSATDKTYDSAMPQAPGNADARTTPPDYWSNTSQGTQLGFLTLFSVGCNTRGRFSHRLAVAVCSPFVRADRISE